MREEIGQLGARHVADVQSVNRNLLEKALQMRCQGYLSQVKAQLLTATIFEIDHSKKNLLQSQNKLAEQNRLIEQQKDLLEEKNRQLELVQAELETRVRERTGALEQLTRDLQEEIAERKRSERDRLALVEKYLEAQKLETIGRLAAGTAHELNNPLSAILQNLQVARDRLQVVRPNHKETAEKCGLDLSALRCYLQREKIDEILSNVRDGGVRAAAIVENLLSFSRKDESKFVPHNVVKLLEETVQILLNDFDHKSRYDFRDIQIEREYAENLPEVPCSGRKLQQAFLNILKNGAQALNSSGQMQGRIPHISLKVRADEASIIIEIGDNGPGISTDVMQYIFEPFFSTKHIGQGAGLGLAVANFIVSEVHDGRLTVVSTPEEGTCFTILLPL